MDGWMDGWMDGESPSNKIPLILKKAIILIKLHLT